MAECCEGPTKCMKGDALCKNMDTDFIRDAIVKVLCVGGVSEDQCNAAGDPHGWEVDEGWEGCRIEKNTGATGGSDGGRRHSRRLQDGLPDSIPDPVVACSEAGGKPRLRETCFSMMGYYMTMVKKKGITIEPGSALALAAAAAAAAAGVGAPPPEAHAADTSAQPCARVRRRTAGLPTDAGADPKRRPHQ
eukprot:gene43640-38702_t